MYNPWAYMLFVRYAKTGAIMNTTSSEPVSKSRIKSFTQLVPGDYLVVKPRAGWSHHCIIVSVDSSVKCTAIESHQRGTATKIELNFPESKEYPVYYRIDYEPGACLPNEEVVKKAISLVGSGKLTDIHYLKTNQKNKVDINSLKCPDDLSLSRGLLGAPQHIQIIKCADKLARGDHIIYKVSKPPFRPIYRSGLVCQICENQQLEIFTKRAESGVVKELHDFDTLTNLHQVIYLSCHCSETEVIAHANECLERQDSNYDERYLSLIHI